MLSQSYVICYHISESGLRYLTVSVGLCTAGTAVD